MLVYLNGRILPEERAVVSIHDRGFLAGDGLFETLRVYDGEPFLWHEHMERFFLGSKTLRLVPPLSSGELFQVVRHLVARNELPECMVRFTLSRGPGPRGFSFHGADQPTLLVTTHPVPAKPPNSCHAITSSIHLPAHDPFAWFKHSNRLRQILARAEADDQEADEAILLNTDGNVAEGTTTNVFWVEGEMVCTAPEGGILHGTTRHYVLELCRRLNIETAEKFIDRDQLLECDGAFVTSSGIEIVEISSLDGHVLRRSPIVGDLKAAYRAPAE